MLLYQRIIGRKVLILDTITQFDDTNGNFESAEGVFDLGGTDSTSNPTNFNSNIQSSGFYTFANTISLDAVYDVNLGAVIGMSTEDDTICLTQVEVQLYLKMLKHLLMVALKYRLEQRYR